MARRSTVEVSFYIECSECGRDLDARVQAETVIVTPCERCMKNKYQEGFDEARDKFNPEP
jgi:DNA replicative helicase MCM subunit Mcm2 (Cdc46/Mcm family)